VRHPADEIAGFRKSRSGIGGRPIRRARAGSTRANSRSRLAANMPVLSDLAREAVIAAVTTGTPPRDQPSPVGAAVALRALLPQTSVLTAHERGLLHEWLDRIASS